MKVANVKFTKPNVGGSDPNIKIPQTAAGGVPIPRALTFVVTSANA